MRRSAGAKANLRALSLKGGHQGWLVLLLLGLAEVPPAYAQAMPPAGGGSRGAAAALAAEARQALRQNEYAKAAAALERLLKMTPETAEVHANLALAYYHLGRLDGAAQQARQALKLKPSLAYPRFVLALSLAESGRCREALPYLREDYPQATDPPLKRSIGTEAVRCAMSLNQPDQAVDWIRSLTASYPDDPEVLYLASHVYSELSTQASQHLLATAPDSYQAHQFNAEVLAFEGKLDEAISEYHKVLSLKPNLPGIHYQLGQLLLAGAKNPSAVDEARREFEEELKVDPHNAAAEYELGEMARQSRQWNEAIAHFQRAAGVDPDFAEALIGLGKSLISAGRTPEAVEPLKRAVEVAPENPNAHYQLSFAYRRLGQEAEAAKELAAYREAQTNLRRKQQSIRAGILGNMVQPQSSDPPE
jgi:tetratricopeptide (TPR) repeat protein